MVKSLICRARYRFAGTHHPTSVEDSIHAALGWLSAAQDVTGYGGFSRAYSLAGGWEMPYPETTGYIIPTLLACHSRFPELKLVGRAERAGSWLAEIQFDSGAICSKQWHAHNTTPSVFNTGMVLHGWVSLLERGLEDRLQEAARKAVSWLVAQQEADGAWARAAFNSVAHTYYTMVDWALLRYAALSSDPRAQESAVKNLDWTLRQQRRNGWFDRCWFNAGDAVTTHTLSYTTQGLVESGQLLGEREYIEAAERATTPLLLHFETAGKLAGAFDENWHPTVAWECCTGNAQTSLVWQTLGQITGDRKWIVTATKLNRRLLQYQKVNCRVLGINGAIPGSWPIDGGYDSLAFPNHAAKFYIDAMRTQGALLGNP
jgi:hypothetical protein